MSGHTPGPFVVDIQGRRYCVRTKAVGTGIGEMVAQHIEFAADAHLFAGSANLLAAAHLVIAALRQRVDLSQFGNLETWAAQGAAHGTPQVKADAEATHALLAAINKAEGR